LLCPNPPEDGAKFDQAFMGAIVLADGIAELRILRKALTKKEGS